MKYFSEKHLSMSIRPRNDAYDDNYIRYAADRLEVPGTRPRSMALSHEQSTSPFKDEKMSGMGLLCMVKATQRTIAVA
jgi:hypothetical protein